MVSADTARGRCHYHPVIMSPISLTPCQHHFLTACRGGRSKALHSAFADVNEREPQFFLHSCLPGEEQVVSKRVPSCEAAHFLVLWLGRAGLSWDFLCPCLIVSGLLTSSALSLIYLRQKANKGTCYILVPCISRSLANLPYSLHLLELCYIGFFI